MQAKQLDIFERQDYEPWANPSTELVNEVLRRPEHYGQALGIAENFGRSMASSKLKVYVMTLPLEDRIELFGDSQWIPSDVDWYQLARGFFHDHLVALEDTQEEE